MNVSISDRLTVPRSIVETVREREVTFLAAGISYYVLVSLVPLLTLAVLVATVIGGADLAASVQAVAEAYLLPTGSDLVLSALSDPAGRGPLSVLSLGLTVWGSLKLFRGVDIAFARVYGYSPEPILAQLSDGLVTLVSLALATLGVVITTTVMAIVNVPFIGLVGPLVLLGFLVVAFLPLYTIIPDIRVGVRGALPGAAFAAIGWAVLSAGFGLYAQFSSGVAGALGAILLLVTWFYLSGILILTGAAVNAVLAGVIDEGGWTDDGEQVHGGDRQVQHPAGRRADKTMSADDATTDDAADESPPEDDVSSAGDAAPADTDVEPRGAPDIDQLDRRVEELRADLDAFESDVQSRTVDRPDVESEMRRYVRGRLRGGKARGWGPYLVLLYGTATTISAFYLLDDDLLAVAAMLIIYLSTLGLYALFVVFGVGLNALGVPGRLVDWIRDRRS